MGKQITMISNNRKEHYQVNYFTGKEVEHTPVYGMNTLFVVGCRPFSEVLDQIEFHPVKHVYLGANGSFAPDEQWYTLVDNLLDIGLWVTLDFDISHVEWILDAGFTEQHRFVAMISAKLPYINQLGYNACLKIDDREFEGSNPGVWVHRVHELLDKKVFTPWDHYHEDNVLDD